MKDKQITISLTEYKELLLKERPNDNDKWLLEKIKNYIASQCELDSNYKEIITIRDSYDFARDLLKFIKMIDLDFYKLIVKKCYDDKLKEEETKLRIEKMNTIKELNKEAKDDSNNE